MDVGRRFPSHALLANRTSQYIYLYLVHYLSTVAREFIDGNIRILDWGCGKGHITYLLRKQFSDITSCDVVSGEDSSFGQDTPIIAEQQIDVVPLTDAVILPFDDNAFDVVCSFGVLEHVPDDIGSLEELSRVLKPAGLFFCFFLPQRWSWTQRLAHLRGDYYHKRLYTFPQAATMLNSVGLELLDGWRRQLFPKNRINYPFFRQFERFDQLLCKIPPLNHLATNLEFVAKKGTNHHRAKPS